jgi:hypothetical protein
VFGYRSIGMTDHKKTFTKFESIPPVADHHGPYPR